MLVEDYLPKDVVDELRAAEKKVDLNSGGEPSRKKMRLKGRNKKRPVQKKVIPAQRLCPAIKEERHCSFGDKCRFIHDVKKYMESKPNNLGDKCYMFETYGKCQFGITCLFGEKHINEDFKNIVNTELSSKLEGKPSTSNYLDKDLQHMLWKRCYDFSKANHIIKQIGDKGKAQHQMNSGQSRNTTSSVNCDKGETRSGNSAKNISDIGGTMSVSNSAENVSDIGGTVSVSNSAENISDIGGTVSVSNSAENISDIGGTVSVNSAESECQNPAVSSVDIDVPVDNCDPVSESGTGAENVAQPELPKVKVARAGAVTDEDMIKLRPQEKKRVITEISV